jgi:hypothetical protein
MSLPGRRTDEVPDRIHALLSRPRRFLARVDMVMQEQYREHMARSPAPCALDLLTKTGAAKWLLLDRYEGAAPSELARLLTLTLRDLTAEGLAALEEAATPAPTFPSALPHHANPSPAGVAELRRRLGPLDAQVVRRARVDLQIYECEFGYFCTDEKFLDALVDLSPWVYTARSASVADRRLAIKARCDLLRAQRPTDPAPPAQDPAPPPRPAEAAAGAAPTEPAGAAATTGAATKTWKTSACVPAPVEPRGYGRDAKYAHSYTAHTYTDRYAGYGWRGAYGGYGGGYGDGYGDDYDLGFYGYGPPDARRHGAHRGAHGGTAAPSEWDLCDEFARDTRAALAAERNGNWAQWQRQELLGGRDREDEPGGTSAPRRGGLLATASAGADGAGSTAGSSRAGSTASDAGAAVSAGSSFALGSGYALGSGSGSGSGSEAPALYESPARRRQREQQARSLSGPSAPSAAYAVSAGAAAAAHSAAAPVPGAPGALPLALPRRAQTHGAADNGGAVASSAAPPAAVADVAAAAMGALGVGDDGDISAALRKLRETVGELRAGVSATTPSLSLHRSPSIGQPAISPPPRARPV